MDRDLTPRKASTPMTQKNNKRRGPRPGHVDPDRTVAIQTRVPGFIKNELIDFADKEGMPLSQATAIILKTFLEEERGIPQPPPAEVPVPTLRAVLQAYHEGTSLIGPCGQAWDTGCSYQTCGVRKIDNAEFCADCGIRTR